MDAQAFLDGYLSKQAQDEAERYFDELCKATGVSLADRTRTPERDADLWGKAEQYFRQNPQAVAPTKTYLAQKNPYTLNLVKKNFFDEAGKPEKLNNMMQRLATPRAPAPMQSAVPSTLSPQVASK